MRINKAKLPLLRRFYLLNAALTSAVPQSISTSPAYTSWLTVTIRSETSTYLFSHSLSTLKTRSLLMDGSSASPKCLSTRFFKDSMPLRSSLASCECTSFLNVERECEDRCATDCGLPLDWLMRVSADSMNSCCRLAMLRTKSCVQPLTMSLPNGLRMTASM